jgi:16S rRNA (cytosine1402-N4)-methyltransferase
MEMEHLPVMIKEIEQLLALKEGEFVVDATLGLGGHSKMMLENIAKTGKLFAFDQDESNLNEAQKRLSQYENQVVYIKDNFKNLKTRLWEKGVQKIDAILFDLGICSTHVDIAERGFSFMKDARLDMRFDKSAKFTAEKLINEYGVEEMTRVFREYGEEKSAWRIANAICERRKEKKFENTLELADFIKSVYPKIKLKVHPATKIFQAIRLEVNKELEVLKVALEDSFELLNKNGRIAIISYHSLEDRIVKKFFKNLLQPKAEGEEQVFRTTLDPLVEAITKKVLLPSKEEIEKNPRSRSAKLRIYKKII